MTKNLSSEIDLSIDYVEDIRQREYGKAMSIGVLLGGAAFSILAMTSAPLIYGIPLFSAVAYGTCQLRYMRWMQAAAPKFKRTILSQFISERFPGFDFEPEIDTDIELLSQSGLFTGKFVSAAAEDMVLGKVDDVNFKFFELSLHTTMSETGATQPPFDGIFMQATFPRRLTDDVIIIPRRHITSAFKRNREKLISDGLERVELEVDMFNEAFEVWSRNEIEARYALPIVFQERLVRLHMQMQAPISASIKNQEFFLAFESGYDLFEPDLEQLSSRENLERAAKQLRSMVVLIKSLQLRGITPAADISKIG